MLLNRVSEVALTTVSLWHHLAGGTIADLLHRIEGQAGWGWSDATRARQIRSLVLEIASIILLRAFDNSSWYRFNMECCLVYEPEARVSRKASSSVRRHVCLASSLHHGYSSSSDSSSPMISLPLRPLPFDLGGGRSPTSSSCPDSDTKSSDSSTTVNRDRLLPIL